MYLTQLRLRNIRLFDDIQLAFDRRGPARMWTGLTGVNGLCKTTVLHAIALAASGERGARAVVGDANDYLRGLPSRTTTGDGEMEASPTGDEAWIEAGFAREESDPALRYADGRFEPLRLRPRLTLARGRHEFRGEVDTRHVDLIREVRAAGFLVLGYGVGRTLPRPGEAELDDDHVKQRVAGLFDTRHKMLSIDFFPVLKRYELHIEFGQALYAALFGPACEVLRPWFIPGRDRLSESDFLTSLDRRQVYLDVAEQRRIAVPPHALAHGYQSLISLVSDILGHAILDEQARVSPADLHAIVLIDELDLHLHPTWQQRMVPFLRAVFPKVQFIVTTHSPVMLASFERDEIIQLDLEEDHIVQAKNLMEPGLLMAEEILSGFFALPQTGRPDLLAKERRYVELLGVTSRSTDQEAERQTLEKELARYWPDGRPNDAMREGKGF